MRKIFYSEDAQEAFLNKGFVDTPLISSREVSLLIREFLKLKPLNNDFTVPDDAIGRTTCHSTLFDPDLNYRRRARALITEVFAPKINRMIIDYEILLCNFMVKGIGGHGYIPLHTHPKMLQDFNELAITIWCPLVDSDEINGTLQLIEGSHHILPEIALPHLPQCFSEFEDILFENYTQIIPTKAGDAVIFDDDLIHGSKPNNGALPRFAVQISCIPRGLRPIFLFSGQSAADQYFNMYQVDKEFFRDYTIEDIISPSPKLEQIGTVKNTNRKISEKEFDELLSNGKEIRSVRFDGIGN